jgi:hypothetical protein
MNDSNQYIELQKELTSENSDATKLPEDKTIEIKSEETPLLPNNNNQNRNYCNLLCFSVFFALASISFATLPIGEIRDYNNFYDSSCLLTNITINRYNMENYSVIFSFIINHNSKNFTAQVNELCNKYKCDSPTYESDWFSCKLIQSTNATYSFETDRGSNPVWDLIICIVFSLLCVLASLCFLLAWWSQKRFAR